MGRRAGVTSDDMKDDLLIAAARVFARSGFEAASVADICAEAKMSTGPVYRHFESKHGLFNAVLAHYGQDEFRRVMSSDDDSQPSIADVIESAGRSIERQPTELSKLVIEAIAMSGRDESIGSVVRSWLERDEQQLAAEIETAQAAGELLGEIDPATMTRMATIISLGAHMTNALGLDQPDQDEWSSLVEQLIGALRTPR
ncbi:TetR/AcrR family transcriptional regulator [Actinospongicola halichondriae]|uniref:TetR/AcrR family transcriptional regulator n=1 Tax=Actinospongicola halichondriae TaxID=3236844 RepID=UPI003D5666B3